MNYYYYYNISSYFWWKRYIYIYGWLARLVCSQSDLLGPLHEENYSNSLSVCIAISCKNFHWTKRL